MVQTAGRGQLSRLREDSLLAIWHDAIVTLGMLCCWSAGWGTTQTGQVAALGDTILTKNSLSCSPVWFVVMAYHDSRTFMIQLLSNTLALYDATCKRSFMFIKRRLHGESEVTFVIQCGVLYRWNVLTTVTKLLIEWSVYTQQNWGNL